MIALGDKGRGKGGGGGEGAERVCASERQRVAPNSGVSLNLQVRICK